MTASRQDNEFLEARPAHLSNCVEQVWYSRGRLPAQRELVLPSATTDIVVNLGAPMYAIEESRKQTICGTTVTGLLTRPLLLEHPIIHEAIGFRLSPLGLRRVLNLPAAEVLNAVVNLEDLLGTDELVDACSNASTAPEKLQIAVDWLNRKVDEGHAIQPIVRWLSGTIQAEVGQLPIAELVRQSGYSQAYLTRVFVNEFGVTPKTFARLVRFRAALDAINSGAEYAQAAYELGYTDQSHMYKDFREFAHTTPAQVIRGTYEAGLTMAIDE